MTAHPKPRKKILKNFSKPLDKCHKVWYNISVRGKGNPLTKPPKIKKLKMECD